MASEDQQPWQFVTKLSDIYYYLYRAASNFNGGESLDVTTIALTLFISCASFLILYFICRKKEVLVVRPAVAKPRFRKRDKVKYYGRMILRKSKQVVNTARSKGKSKQEFMRLAKSLLRFRRESKQLVPKEPPSAILDPDLGGRESDLGLPTEFVYMLRNVRVFGHIDKPVYMELCKHIEVITLRANQYLFQIGDPDESIYVIQEGLIDVFIKEKGEERLMKEVAAGDSIHSLLSILDVLTGHPAPYKTVYARAKKDSTVLRLPAASFEKAFRDFPESMVRVVQVIMVRLIRVTFWALHNYLGLDTQLINPRAYQDVEKTLSVHGIQMLTSDEARNMNEDSRQFHDMLHSLAMQDLAKIFQLENPELLQNKVTVCQYQGGHQLCNQGDADADLMFVIKGQLHVSQRIIDQEEKESVLFSAGPGEVVGVLSILSGEPSIFTVRTSVPSFIAHITKASFYAIMTQKPHITLAISHLLVKRLSPFVRQIDFALDWAQVDSGRAVYRKDDPSDNLYIILNGRIRTIIEGPGGKKSVSGEYGKGELIGIAEVITKCRRTKTAMAVRDTELAQIPSHLLDHIRMLYPQIITRLYHLLGNRLMGIQTRMDEENLLRENPSVDPRSPIANISTVAIVPASDSVPLTAFTLELQHALSTIAHSLRLTSDIIEKKLGSWALDPVNDYRLSSWLSSQEDTHRTVIYQCDFRFTPWTQRCIRQSDLILIVALAEESPKPGTLEKSLENMAIRSQKELILLHRADATKPQNTVDWLNARDWCLSHHHIRCPNRVFSKKTPDRILANYETVIKTKPDALSDMSRLARFITGTAIGLVLGGGGARGASQIGLLKAMTEAGIPIDMVGGTSIGSFVGALWCEERNVTRVIQRARHWFNTMTSLWKKILDLTYPITSMMSGYAFNRSIEDVFGDTQIEDLWIPYFNISTDITASKMRVHTSGDLWRYVRASMSLSGYLPPLCDPKDGHLLLDGGYVNNLPADVMKAAGASIIFAVDVGAQEDRNYTNYGDHLSGWWLLWKRWNPWAEPVRVPAMEEIQSHLAYISCVKNLESIKHSAFCEYVRPPIDKFQTLQFHAFEEILECGYNYAKPYFAGIIHTEKLKNILRSRDVTDSLTITPGLNPETSSMTDLADILSQVKETAAAATNAAFNISDAISALLHDDDTDEDSGRDDESGATKD